MYLRALVVLIIFIFSSLAVIAGGGGGGGCTPSTPTFYCPYVQGGTCFDSEGLTTSQLLAVEDFGKYVPVDACSERQARGDGCGGSYGCTCQQGQWIENVEITEPDEHQGACLCIQKTEWEDVDGDIGCCGDDLADCGLIGEDISQGRVINRFLCVMDENLLGSWKNAEANLGDIAYVSCSESTSRNGAYLSAKLSDGSEDWVKCTEFNIRESNGHEYMCIPEMEEEAWIECCGEDFCNSNNAGKRLSSGHGIQVGNDHYYCGSNRKFTLDLDTTDKATCEGAGFFWSGNLCCSENDDPNEYYNDPGGIGGCWNNETVRTGDLLENNPNIANFDGVFFGCNIEDQVLLSQTDSHTGETLIQNQETCYQDPAKFYICNAQGSWDLANGVDQSHLSFVIPEVNSNPSLPSACCATGECWDGDSCQPNQRNDPRGTAINGYRCVDGEWSDTPIKTSPDDPDKSGFCPYNDQCFVSLSGNPNDNNNTEGNPQCITSGQYMDNRYCDGGFWTSRTKLIAEQFLKKVESGDNYIIFCDTPQNTLNNLNYQIGGTAAADLINSNTNNFCVLLWNGQVILGTSLITGLEDDQTLVDALGVTGCSAAFSNTENSFVACGSNQESARLWYNKNLKLVLFSTGSFRLQDSTITNLITKFNNFVNSISGNTFEPFDKSFFDDLKLFEKLYISKIGNRQITGTAEGFGGERLLIEYKSFDTNICDSVNAYSGKFSDENSRIACEKQDSTYYVIAEGSSFANIKPQVLWNDLTSKLRVS